MQRVVITGMGVICPLGVGTQEFWKNLAAGKSGISAISRFDATNYPAKVAGEVNNFDPLDHMDAKTMQRNPRAVHFAIPTLNEALAQSRLDMSREAADRVGVIGANMLEYHFVGQDWMRLMNHGPRRVDPLLFVKAGPSIVSLQVGMMLGATGPNFSVNSL
jgi:3-oxoacyl-[acyl-carrier-protein] synthase II